MDILKYGSIVLLSLTALIILILCVRSGKPFKYFFMNALPGIAALIVIDLTSKFTGVHIPVNQWTAAGVSLYGIPGVFGFLAFPFIFK